jgi:hypothetical protein
MTAFSRATLGLCQDPLFSFCLAPWRFLFRFLRAIAACRPMRMHFPHV